MLLLPMLSIRVALSNSAMLLLVKKSLRDTYFSTMQMKRNGKKTQTKLPTSSSIRVISSWTSASMSTLTVKLSSAWTMWKTAICQPMVQEPCSHTIITRVRSHSTVSIRSKEDAIACTCKTSSSAIWTCSKAAMWNLTAIHSMPTSTLSATTSSMPYRCKTSQLAIPSGRTTR